MLENFQFSQPGWNYTQNYLPILVCPPISSQSIFKLRARHGKFDGVSYYRNQMHQEQTDKHCCLYKQEKNISASKSYTHIRCDKVTMEG